MMKKAASYNGTQAVTRAIQLLKFFDDDNPQWELQDLTEASGLNKSTVFRILTALESEGLIARDNGSYYLGSEMIVLGGRAMRSNNLRRVSREHLEQLSHQTGESVTLEVLHLDDGDKLCSLAIDEVVSRHLVGITQYIGSRLPVHATSTGKILMAFQSSEVIKTIKAKDLKTYTDKTHKSLAAFKEELNHIKQKGYALAKGELEQGLMTAAAPVFDANAKVQAAVSIIAPSIRVNESKLKDLAKETIITANRISEALGHRK